MADSMSLAPAIPARRPAPPAPSVTEPLVRPHVPAARRGLRLLLDVHSDPLRYFTALMEQEGAYAWLRLRGQLVLMLNDATGIQHVLQTNARNYRKARFAHVLRPLLGDGIFLSEGALWRRQRQESAPVFANGNFRDMTTEMVAATEAMCARWEPRIARGEAIDVPLEMMWLALDILLRALFHESREDVAAGMQTALGHLLGEAEGRIWSAVNLPQRLVLQRAKYRRSMAFIDDIVHGLIDARRQNRAYPDDLLSRLVESYGASRQDRRMLRHQVVSFLLAGHETTAHGLAWSLYQLSLHPAALRTLTAEVDGALGTRVPTLEDIPRLPYCRQVFEEVLRLYPPVWTLSREAISADAIPLEDGRRLELPPDAAVMLCTYAVHRRSTYWEHPESFDPDRFAPEAAGRRPRMAWFPFGGGPRLCLGHKFAQMEAVLALAIIAQRYTLTLLPGQRVSPQPIITLRPSGPIRFRIERRVAPSTRRAPIVRDEADEPGPNLPGGCPYHRAAAGIGQRAEAA